MKVFDSAYTWSLFLKASLVGFAFFGFIAGMAAYFDNSIKIFFTQMNITFLPLFVLYFVIFHFGSKTKMVVGNGRLIYSSVLGKKVINFNEIIKFSLVRGRYGSAYYVIKSADISIRIGKGNFKNFAELLRILKEKTKIPLSN